MHMSNSGGTIYLIDPADDHTIARFEQMTYALLAGRGLAMDLKRTLVLREGDGRLLVATFTATGETLLAP
jgi:hypothetical protein